MDEIDWIKTIKKVLMLFFKVSIGFTLFCLWLLLVQNIHSNAWNNIDYQLKRLFLVLILPPLAIYLVYIFIVIIEKIINSGRTVINFNKEYIRDLPKYCSPAITSLIYDLKIDVYKDYTSTILYLCTKKYLDLKKIGNSYELELGKFNDYSALCTCEKYVLDIIKNNYKFDEYQFAHSIIIDAKEKGLITNKKYSKNLKLFSIYSAFIILLIATFIINLTLCAFCVLFIFPCMFLLPYMKNTEYKRTKDGKNIALLLKGLKKYMKEYTLIKDKEIDYIQILENYIPYALALDEADAVEEFIKNNEEYRNLIYNRKIDK